MMYEVNWSIVGKEPESEGYLFDDWSKAYQFLSDEIYHLRFVFEEYEADVSSVLNQLYNKVNVSDGKDLTFTVGNIAYWLLARGLTLDDELSVFDRYKL